MRVRFRFRFRFRFRLRFCFRLPRTDRRSLSFVLCLAAFVLRLTVGNFPNSYTHQQLYPPPDLAVDGDGVVAFTNTHTHSYTHPHAHTYIYHVAVQKRSCVRFYVIVTCFVLCSCVGVSLRSRKRNVRDCVCVCVCFSNKLSINFAFNCGNNSKRRTTEKLLKDSHGKCQRIIKRRENLLKKTITTATIIKTTN